MGSVELWEETITRVLRRKGVTTALVTDHPHLFETGGENYHTDFHCWDYLRGHEGDPWRTYHDPSWVGTPAMPARAGGWWFSKAMGFDLHDREYDRSRTFFRGEDDYPGPKTMGAASRFLAEATPHHDRWFLFLDEFDPHEPLRHPGAMGGPVSRRAVGRGVGDLAALRRRCYLVGKLAGAGGSPRSGQLRGQAVDDRPLVSAGSWTGSTSRACGTTQC